MLNLEFDSLVSVASRIELLCCYIAMYLHDVMTILYTTTNKGFLHGWHAQVNIPVD